METETIGPKVNWARELKRKASDAKSMMRLHALSLLCFADGIEDDVVEALQKGGRLTYTIQVSQQATGKGDSADSS